MTTTALTSVQKQRAATLKDMLPATRDVAKSMEEKLSRTYKAASTAFYDIGVLVVQVMKDEAKYGTDPVGQLAEYLNFPGGRDGLYQLSSIAERFERGFIQSHAEKPMANGNYLTTYHWVELARIEDEPARQKMLRRVMAESMSALDVARERKALGLSRNRKPGAGRKPSRPTSPISGLQQTCSVAQKLANLEPVLSEAVFDEIDKVSSDRVDSNLLEKLIATKQEVVRAGRTCNALNERLKRNISRVERVLDIRNKSDKAAKSTKAKAIKNGQAKRSNKAKGSGKLLRRKKKRRALANA